MKWLTHWVSAILTLAVISFIGLSDPYVKQLLRLKSFDVIQQYDTPVLSQDIAILEIDERAIEKYGQWPWKRDVLADVIQKLRETGVGVIVLPVLFSEPDRLGGDLELAQKLSGNGIIIAQVGTSQGVNKNAVPRGVAKIGDPMPWLFEWPGMLGPIEILGQNADGVGVINTAPEIDGVTRRLPLLMKIGEEVYPSIAIETIRVAVGDPSYQVKAGEGGIIAMRVPAYQTIQTDANGRIWIRWNKQFESISLAEEDYSPLAGKIVIIGTTAEGLGSIIATPNGEVSRHILPATAIQTIVNGDNIVRYDYATFLEYITSIIIGLLLIVTAVRAPYWVVGAVILAVYSTTVYGAYFTFTRHLQLWDWSWIVVVSTIVGFHAVFNRFVREFQLKQQIKKQFEHYLAPAMVKKLQKNPDLLKLGGETKELTILFSDIRGFTPISEQYKTNPQGLTKLINRYMTPMTNIVMTNQGTIDKYIGDALMAFWNAPLDVPEQKKLATQTAIDMLKGLKELNNELESEGLLPINIGIGINTGDVVVGNMGSDQRFDYSVLGDAVNLAARLEGQSKEYGQQLLIGESSKDDLFKYVELDLIAVKGKTEPARIFTIMLEEQKENYYRAHELFLEYYRKAEWTKAIDKAEKLAKNGPQQNKKYYETMIGRCNEMALQNITNETWNGVYVATSK